MDALSTAKERLSLALDAGGGVGMWEWDIPNNRVYTDARFARLFSIDPEKAAAGAPISDFVRAIHADDQKRVADAIDEVVRNGGDFASEYRVVQSDCSTRWVYARGRCHDSRFPGVILDITERKHAELVLAQKARLSALISEVSLALAWATELPHALQECAQAVVTHLDAAFARVWTLDATGKILELQASAGLYTHLDGSHARVPVGSFKIGMIAQERQPHLTNDVLNDPKVSDLEWAKREGMVAFAGYPLIVEGRIGGVLALFSRHSLADDTMQALESVATSVAIGIERKRTEAALRGSEERYRFLAESMPQMVWTATPDGALNYVSGQAASYFGTASENLVGNGWLRGVHEDERERVIALWSESVTTGRPYDVEFRLKRGRDDSWRWFLARAQAMTDQNAVVGWVGTCTDIHEQKLGQEALTKANRELEEFAYVASHDLQEPLRMVNIYTQLLLKRSETVDPVMLQYASFIKQGVVRMDELLRDLLSYSRSVHEEKQAFGTADLTHALREALAILDTRVREVDALINAGPMPVTVGESSQLAHVFQNLLSNALKYCRRSQPEIEIAAEHRAQSWIISVRDNGIGFDPKYAEHIFGLFKRLHKDEYPGTGLGLAICQRIVERYGGRMWASSKPGEGSTFYFSLPDASAV